MRSLGWPSLYLAVLLAACGGGGSKGSNTNPSDPTGAACEPGRCLADISKLIGDHRAESRACYEAGAKKTAGMQGRIIINFRIDSDGNVTETSQGMQDDQITDEGVVGCVS